MSTKKEDIQDISSEIEENIKNAELSEQQSDNKNTLGNLQNALDSFEQNEQKIKNALIIFDEKMINQNVVAIVDKIDYQAKRCYVKVIKNNQVHQKEFSFKSTALETQLVNLQIAKEDIIAVKYLGQKSFNGKTINSFVVKKFCANNSTWITTKS